MILRGFSPPQARKKFDPFIRYFGTGSCREWEEGSGETQHSKSDDEIGGRGSEIGEIVMSFWYGPLV